MKQQIAILKLSTHNIKNGCNKMESLSIQESDIQHILGRKEKELSEWVQVNQFKKEKSLLQSHIDF